MFAMQRWLPAYELQPAATDVIYAGRQMHVQCNIYRILDMCSANWTVCNYGLITSNIYCKV